MLLVCACVTLSYLICNFNSHITAPHDLKKSYLTSFSSEGNSSDPISFHCRAYFVSKKNCLDLNCSAQ